MKLLTTITLLCISFAANAQESEIEVRILSAYHGLDPIRPRATGLCGLPPMGGQDGMPVTFSVQINSETVSATAFAVETSSGKFVTPPVCNASPRFGVARTAYSPSYWAF